MMEFGKNLGQRRWMGRRAVPTLLGRSSVASLPISHVGHGIFGVKIHAAVPAEGHPKLCRQSRVVGAGRKACGESTLTNHVRMTVTIPPDGMGGYIGGGIVVSQHSVS